MVLAALNDDRSEERIAARLGSYEFGTPATHGCGSGVTGLSLGLRRLMTCELSLSRVGTPCHKRPNVRYVIIGATAL